MKKTGLVIAFCILIFALSCTGSCAYATSECESIADMAGASDIKSEYLDADELSGDKSINIFQKALSIIADAVTESGRSAFGSFGAVLGVLILCCVMGNMKFGESEALDSACGFISILVLSAVTYNLLYRLFVLVIAALETLTVTISSFLPVMASLYVFGGSSAACAAETSALAVFLSILEILCTKVVLPLMRLAFAFCMTGALPGCVNLGSVTALIRNTATTLLAFIFTLLGFVLYFQTSVASASDGFVARSVRFASGVFVPVIGGMLGDAARTVMASVSVIKGTVGAAGVVTVLAILIPPLLAVVINKLMLLGCAIIAKTMGCERESAFLYDLGNVLGVLLALVVGAGAVAVIAMAVFVKTGVA